MSVFEVGTTISESTGGHASAGGNSGAGNRFFFSDDAYCELGLQRGTAYNVRIRLKGATSGFIKLTMIGHRGYAPYATGNYPFCYIVEALPQNMGDRTSLSLTTTGINTKSFEDGIEAQHIMGPALQAGDFYPTVSCFQYTDYTEITLRVMNKSTTQESKDNRSNVVDTTATDHSAALTKHYAGNEDTTTTGQAGEMGGDAIFFTAYIEGYSYNSTLTEGIFTSYNRIFGGRGVMTGGYTTTNVDTIDYVTIGVLGDAVDFGELTGNRNVAENVTNGSRAVIGGADVPPQSNIIEYLTFNTIGDSKDFGDLTQARSATGATSDGSRGVFGAGNVPPFTDLIDYVTIGIKTNALDFGELTQARQAPGSTGNGSRGLFYSGENPGGNVATIDFITIGNLTNGIDFGDVTTNRRYAEGVEDGSRGVIGSGWVSANSDVMDYVNMSVTGNATDFGNLTSAAHAIGAGSDGSRGILTGGYVGTTSNDRIEYITISTTGNATDFSGELTSARQHCSTTSGD